MKGSDWKRLAFSLLLPLGAGGLSGFLLRDRFAVYKLLYKPLLAPPALVFPIVWTLLYLLMGYACYRVLSSGVSPERMRRALLVYGLQLGINVLWPWWFFGLQLWGFAFFWALLLLGAVWLCYLFFFHVEEKSGRLLLPYLLWCAFAGYLSAGVWLLN